MKKIAFHTLGCKLNFSETSSIRRSFEGDEYEITGFDETADIYVINTCSVTLDANRDCRKVVRSALRQNPNAYVAVTGCYAQLEPQEIAEIPGVSLVLGAKDKFSLPELIQKHDAKAQPEPIIFHSDVNDAVSFHHAFSSGDRTRAFLKVQDGCDYKCSFCTIPLARGKSRSPEISEIVENAHRVAEEGFREAIITGVNAGDFGKQHDENFLELLRAVDQVKGLDRIRISSIEPNLLSDDIIRFTAESRIIQPHFHIPLQSGSDTMLRLMKRRYRSNLYRRRVELIRELMPYACIGVDVITGHPGETEDLHRESLDFVNSLDVSYLHVFTYSERPNTHALKLEPVIPKPIRKKRTAQFRRLSDKKRFEYNSRFKNDLRPVLFEQEEKDGFMYGWSDNYLRVEMPYSDALTNSIVNCKLGKYDVENQWFSGSAELDSLAENFNQNSLALHV